MGKDTQTRYNYKDSKNVVSNLLIMKFIFVEVQKYSDKADPRFEPKNVDTFYDKLGVSPMTFSNIAAGNNFFIPSKRNDNTAKGFKNCIMDMLGIGDSEFDTYFSKTAALLFELPRDGGNTIWNAFMRSKWDLGESAIRFTQSDEDRAANKMIEQIVSSYIKNELDYVQMPMVYRMCYYAHHKRAYDFSSYWPNQMAAISRMTFDTWKTLDENNHDKVEKYISILKHQLDLAETVHRYNSFRKLS